MRKALFLFLLLAACRRGPHVTEKRVMVTMYACSDSGSVWHIDRTVAVCATVQECNEVCARLSR